MGLVVGILGSLGIFFSHIEGADSTLSDATTSPPAQLRLWVSPENPWVKPGETVTLAVHADGGVGISAAELTLRYGRDIELVEVRPGSYLGQDTLAGPNTLEEELRRATYAWARIGDTPAQLAPGEIAFITMRAKSGYPWNTWVSAEVGLADRQFKKFQRTSLPFNLHVYDKLPVPILVQPASRFRLDDALTGPQPVFSLKTLSPGTFQYKIEVSQEGSSSALYTFDQTVSPDGWDKTQYRGEEMAELASAQSLQAGRYQWRAYAWVQEIGRWGPPSRPERFEVRSEPVGVTRVSPTVVSSESATGVTTAIDGWGFTPSTRARLTGSGGRELTLDVQWEGPSRITVTIPTDVRPGLLERQLSQPSTRELIVPLLVLPPTLFAVHTELPWSNQIIPDEEFSVRVLASNYGADPNGVAVIAVHLPNPVLFELVHVSIDGEGQVLEQGPALVVLSVRDRSQATFKFRPGEKLVTATGVSGVPSSSVKDVKDPREFDFRPTLLGAVSGTQWSELEHLTAPQKVEAVQMESGRRMEQIAQTFNDASYKALRSMFQQLTADNESYQPLLELVAQLQGHGLDLDRITALLADAPTQIQASLFRLDGIETSPRQLQVVSSLTPDNLLAEPAGFGPQSHISEEQPITYSIRFENPAEAREPVNDITVTAQLGPGLDLRNILSISSSHPDIMRMSIDEPRSTVTGVFNNINLPPNQYPPQGEGWVRLSVRPLADVPSGTITEGKAAVGFDSGPPLETNKVTYTIDSQPPSTRVSPIPSVQFIPTFQVPWTGGDEDGGSGIQRVALLASRNGGPLEVVKTGLESPFSFSGEPGATYGLATQGIDHMGHAEEAPSEPDVVVTVGQPLTFEPGLYLMGIPVVIDEHSREQLAARGGSWSIWDTATQKYLPVKSVPSSPNGVDSRPGYGLWAQFDHNAEVVLTGQPVPDDQPYVIDLSDGWNLIANPFTSPMSWSLDEVKVRAEGKELTLGEAQSLGWAEDFLWDWNGKAYEVVYDASVVPGIASKMEPFRGYWLEAHRDLTLVLPPPGNQG